MSVKTLAIFPQKKTYLESLTIRDSRFTPDNVYCHSIVYEQFLLTFHPALEFKEIVLDMVAQYFVLIKRKHSFGIRLI